MKVDKTQFRSLPAHSTDSVNPLTRLTAAGRFWLLYIAMWVLAMVLLAGKVMAGDFGAMGIPLEAVHYKADLTRNARAVAGINAPVSTYAAQIHQESHWRKDAKSRFAAGLAQFTPDTARWIAGAYPAELRDGQPFNPGWALRALVRYDQHLLQRVAGRDTCQRMAFALSAYNGGLGWVQRDKAAAKAAGADPLSWFDSVERFNAGRAPAYFRENRDYPRRILFQHEPRYVAAGWGLGSC